MSYQDTHWGCAYPSAEMQSVYSTAPADWPIMRENGGRELITIVLKRYLDTTVDFPNQLEAVEYTDCTSAEGKDPHQRVSWYDTKKSDADFPVMLEL